MVLVVEVIVWGIDDWLVDDWYALIEQVLDVSAPSVVEVLGTADEGHVLTEDCFDDLSSGTAVTETDQSAASLIVLECCYVLVYLVYVAFEVLVWSVSGTAWFLSAPSDESQGSSWSESESFQHSEGFKDSNESSSVIVGSSLWSSVPGINVPSSKNDFIRSLCSYNFKDQIGRVRIRNKLSLNDQSNSDILSSILHSPHHFRVLNCNGSTRNLWIQRIVFHISCMHWVNALWS